ncbi:glucose 6-phosphate dehydrogenase [Salmonella enterica subsp. arizonae]|uniref:Glucose 6-phosphate dehydrogenase n=1 Tax=Salmonella enterica subsp. arizonae TaxID=59203 RepID=A0A379TCK7_SALER|nr:glucose 6-phosphate dehydrogenase [Salmonella enterica subsp. arizonae]
MSACCWRQCVAFRRCLSARDEVEEAWKWVDSITEAWAMDNDAPKPYQAGTWGPVASVAMITRDGRSWNEFE